MKNKISKTLLFLGLAVLTTVPPAFAQDKSTGEPEQVLRERIICFPAESIIKLMSKFQKIDADKRDSVDMLFNAGFEIKDDGVLPERIFLRDNDIETDLTLSADGSVPDFGTVALAPESSEMCFDDPSREGRPRTGKEISFSLDSDVQFLEKTGYHDMATLQDGLKDGKSHYKKMAPGPMKLFIPKFSHVMVQYEDDETRPQFTAMTGQNPIEGLGFETFCDNALIKIQDIKALGGDGLKVTGGAYKLLPVPGAKTLAKFAGCADNETQDDEKEE